MNAAFYRMKVFCLVILLLSRIGAVAQQSFVPAAPYPVTVTQPDGTKFNIQAMGDEFRHFAVTSDGYTVLKNSKGFYEYARMNKAGKLDFSGVRARNVMQRSVRDNNFLKSTEKFLSDTSISTDDKLKSAEVEIHKVFPSSGTQKALLLLIEYPDLEHVSPAIDFDLLMNQENYNGTGSFKDYFFQASNGKLSLSVDVRGWYTAKNSYEYYGENEGDDRARELVAEAVDAAEDAGVDFSEYDNDGDGVVDNLIVAHSGPGAEEGSQKEYIWSHSWSLGSFSRFYDGVTIRPYIIQPETRRYGMVGIGVFCHEFGHALGLPDLYDTDKSDGDSKGLGEWCLMAYGSWLNQEKTPAMLSAWAREELGWVEPVVIDADGDFSLQPAATGDECYKMLTPEDNEYFLLENRYATGFDAALPGTGLAIFHVNTNQSNNDNEELKLTDIEEADARDDLDKNYNRGDAGDLFPGSSLNTYFNDSSYPDSKNYNGNLSGVSIYNIQEEGSALRFSTGKRVLEGIDLAVHPASNKLVVDATHVSVDLQVANEGDQASGSFNVAFYLSEDQSVSTSDVFIGSETLSNLNAGDLKNISFSKDVGEVNPAVPEGAYYVGYIIDYENSIHERNENNNTYCFYEDVFDYCPSDITFLTEVLCQGDSLVYNGEVINKSGVYKFEYQEKNSCDSIVVLEVNVSPSDDITFSETICQGDSVRLGERTLKAPGVYSENFSNVDGCDSTVTLFLDVMKPLENVMNERICAGDSVGVAGRYYKRTGTYTHSLVSQWGCDSTVTMNLTVNQPSDTLLTRSVCAGDSVMLGDQVFKETGIFNQVCTNKRGCDSLVTLDLTVYPEQEVFLEKMICPGDSAEIGPFVYKNSGIFENTFSNCFGCDSLVTLQLNMAPSPEIDLGPDRIMYSSEVLLLDPGAGYSDYAWSNGHDKQLLPVNRSVGTGSQTFEVTVTNSYGCSASDAVEVTIYNDTHSIYDTERNLKVFPNPGSGITNLLIEQVIGKYQVFVYSENGRVVYQNELISPGKKFVKQINLSFLLSGIYTVHVHSSENILVEKLVILNQ